MLADFDAARDEADRQIGNPRPATVFDVLGDGVPRVHTLTTAGDLALCGGWSGSAAAWAATCVPFPARST